MKLLIITFLIAFFTNAQCDLPKNDAGEIEYQQVITLEETSQKTLYNKSLEWVATNFKSAKNVIDLKNDVDLIISKPMYRDSFTFELDGISTPMQYSFSYTLRIDLKDNRARVTVNSIGLEFMNQTTPLEQFCMTPTMTREQMNENFKPIYRNDKKRADKVEEHFKAFESQRDWVLETANRHALDIIELYEKSMSATKKDNW